MGKKKNNEYAERTSCLVLCASVLPRERFGESAGNTAGPEASPSKEPGSRAAAHTRFIVLALFTTQGESGTASWRNHSWTAAFSLPGVTLCVHGDAVFNFLLLNF